MARGLYTRKGSRFIWLEYEDATGQVVQRSAGTSDRGLAQRKLQEALDIVYEERRASRTGQPGIKERALGLAVAEYLLDRQSVWGKAWYATSSAWLRDRIIPAMGGPDVVVARITQETVDAWHRLLRVEQWCQHRDRYTPNRYEKRRKLPGKLMPVCGRAAVLAPGTLDVWVCPVHAKQEEFEDIAKSSVNRITSVASGFFSWAESKSLCLRNPCRGLPHYKEDKRVPPDLSEADLAAWLRAIENPMYRRAATVAMDTGLRASEVRRLRGQDFKRATNTLYVQSTYERGQTKNETDRHVALTPRVVTALEAQLAETGNELFASMGDYRWAMDKAFAATGLPTFRWHDMRHYALTRATRAGMDVHDLKDMAGWTTIAMANNYVHSSLNRQQAAIARMTCPEIEGDTAGNDAKTEQNLDDTRSKSAVNSRTLQ